MQHLILILNALEKQFLKISLANLASIHVVVLKSIFLCGGVR